MNSPLGPTGVVRRGVLWRRVCWVLLVFYLAAVAMTVLWPHHVDDNDGGRRLVQLLALGHSSGWLPAWCDYGLVEWAANLVMFVPGGFLLTLLLPATRSFWVPVGAFVTSCGIEGIQYFMPERTASFADIAANSAGALVGWALAMCSRWWRKNLSSASSRLKN